jgi:hypothetical protein
MHTFTYKCVQPTSAMGHLSGTEATSRGPEERDECRGTRCETRGGGQRQRGHCKKTNRSRNKRDYEKQRKAPPPPPLILPCNQLSLPTSLHNPRLPNAPFCSLHSTHKPVVPIAAATVDRTAPATPPTDACTAQAEDGDMPINHHPGHVSETAAAVYSLLGSRYIQDAHSTPARVPSHSPLRLHQQ